MTSAPVKTKSLKRLLITSAAIIALALALWLWFFIETFDLNDYRSEIQTQLSNHLSLPVAIGDLSFRLHDTNLALSLDRVRIGDEHSAVEINSAQVIANLRWRALWRRRVEFSKVSLIKPDIRFTRRTRASQQSGSQMAAPPLMFDQALLENAHVDRLELEDGTLHIYSAEADQGLLLALDELDGELKNVGVNRNCGLLLNGHLALSESEQGNRWSLQGSISPTLTEQDGLKTQLALDLTARAIAAKQLQRFTPSDSSLLAQGQFDLQLHLNGDPADQIDFRTELVSENLTVSVGPTFAKQIPLSHLALTGKLTLGQNLLAIHPLQLQSDKVSLNGSLNWNRADQTEPFNLTLQSATLPIKRLKQWLPKGTGSLGVFGEGLLNQGTLLVSDLELAKQSVADDDDVDGASHEWQLRRARIEVERGLWRSAAGAEFGLNVFRAVWSQDRLQIEHGQVNYQTVPLFFDGEFLPGGKENTALSLNIHGEVTPQQLLDQHAIAKDVFTLKGAVPFSVRIEGAPEKLRANLLFNLAALSGEIPQRLKITPNAQDQLVMHMTLTPQRLDLDHAQLDWAFLDGHLSGASPWADLDLLQLDALLTISDLALLGAAAPHLKPLNLQGRAELDLSQRGDFTAHPPALTLTLRDVGITGGGHVADLSRINGRIKFGATGLEAKNLRLHLGKSPMTLQVRLDDFSEPNLIIDLVAPKVRADDVIFYSDTAFLYDLKGRMQLNGQRLTFEPVDVRLEGGTQASVRGYVAFDAPVTTELDITSPFVNVGEVIDLWSGDSDDDYADSGSGSGSEQEQHQDARVSIKAHAESGDLYGMQFQKATGLIVPSPQRLVIHPLNFSVDGGFCTAQVISEFEDSQHTRLRISGHAEEIDALTVYRELLNQENIVRGHLRGDFYLEGLTGADFLPSSYGRFNVEVHDGVLHKFPVLSKVFSLLNVSQLLSFSLPDMDSKGMPFDKLQANFVLDKGTISSSDLMIQSEAMNQAYNGSIDLIDEEIDMTMAIHPLGTVDKIVSRVPLAGWLLTGEDQALLTAYFNIEGPTDKPGVTPAPTGTISDTTFGVLMRTLGLPMKLTENPQILWGGEVDKE